MRLRPPCRHHRPSTYTIVAVATAILGAAATAAATVTEGDSGNSKATLSLRHIFRAGFNERPAPAGAGGEPTLQPFMERLDVDDDMLERLWAPDPAFDPAVDAGVRQSFRRGVPSANADDAAADAAARTKLPSRLNVSTTTQQIYAWSEVSVAASRQQAPAAGRAAQAPVAMAPLAAPDSDVGEGFTIFGVVGGGDTVAVRHKDVIIPDYTDNATVLALGLMAFNAYFEPDGKDWRPIPGWDQSDGFGSSGDAIRGYVFTAPDSDLVAIVIKGTSLQTPFTGGPTSANDKLNDNKMFSCCCGKAGWSWTPVCGCANSGATQCDLLCVERESDFKESYYRLATSIAHTVQQIFPQSALWMTGHSLGGALASLVALTFDVPAFTYEAPGDLQFAKRLGLLPPLPPVPPTEEGADDRARPAGLDEWEPYLDTLPIFQFGNDGDPVYIGQCRSMTSSCWFGGYALETKCHVGKECVYDSDLDGRQPLPGNEAQERKSGLTKSVSIYNHGIQYVIDRFLGPWEYVPRCKVNSNYEKCDECEGWQWI